MKPFTTIAIALFTLMAIAHLLRLFAGWPITVADMAIPVWVSWIGMLVAGGLAVMVWRESRS